MANINIFVLYARFVKINVYLCSNTVTGLLLEEYIEALNSFNEFNSEHKDFVCQFANYRGDCISSDREKAAFMLAIKSFK